MPTEDLKEVQKGHLAHQVTKVGISLTREEKHDLVDQLIKNVILFSWPPSNMSVVNAKVVSHRLAIHPYGKLVA